jgi:hypothetical protein
MVVTSVVLYIVPQGRVAYWADWKLWGLSKSDWGNIHINLGLLFLIALGVHLYYNWKPLISYLKNSAKKITVFTAEFNMAAAITVVFVAGTYLLVPPFSWVMTLNDHFKEAGAAAYGEPPYGHAELSALKTFAGKLNLDLDASLQLLEAAGYPVEDGGETMQTIAARYGVPPQKIYETIKPAAMAAAQTSGSANRMPAAPLPGTGNQTLADLCAQYDLSLAHLLRELEQRGLSASADRSLKQIAADNQTSPQDLYETLKAIAQN